MTRNEKKRNRSKIALTAAIIAWAVLLVVVLLATSGNAVDGTTESGTEGFETIQDGRVPGDDIPASERCYLTAEEIEDCENYYIEQALLENAVKLEDVTVTYYCICEKCCGKSENHPAYGITKSGLQATPGVSVAVDPSVIPLGADVLIDYGDGDIQYMRADDTGKGVKGNHIDVCVADHETAINAGVKTATIYWVKEG